MGNLDFNAHEVQPSSPMEAVPAGSYPVRITDTEIKQTKNGNGRYLQITLDIIDGEFKGRKLFDRLNLWNPNQQAVDIARKTMSAICHATNVMQPRNHEELRGKYMTAKVNQENDPQYGARNEVKGYAAIEGAPHASAPVAQPAQAAPATPPWSR
jgi:hypothetical protein